MLIAISLLFASVVATVLIHYEGLRVLSNVVRRNFSNPRLSILTVIFGVFVCHLIEISIYAFTYWLGDVAIDIGQFAGVRSIDTIDYFYFSAESFTALGMGDLYPLGALRLISAMEALNGLLLIGWSASFTYLIMERYWALNGSRAP